MDIRSWPMNQIMQLPDECFGRRFNVCVAVESDEPTGKGDISEIAFPDVCVIWNVTMWVHNADTTNREMRIGLGDQLPGVMADMDCYEPLIPGFGLQGIEPRYIFTVPGYSLVSLPMRNPLNVQGRRLVIVASGAVENPTLVQIVVEVSSIPTEVPDWLISGQGRSR
ncbi:hypothetical protein ES705_42220 [subsurface metagenome]